MAHFHQLIPNIEFKAMHFKTGTDDLKIQFSIDGKDRFGYLCFLRDACRMIIEGISDETLIINEDTEVYLRKFVNSFPDLNNFDALCEQLSWTDHILGVVSDIAAGTSRPIDA